MTATRPAVPSAPALMVARKPMNHSASPPPGCSAMGLGAGMGSVLIGDLLLGWFGRWTVRPVIAAGCDAGSAAWSWLAWRAGRGFGGRLELLKCVAHGLVQLAVPVGEDVEDPGPGRDP